MKTGRPLHVLIGGAGFMGGAYAQHVVDMRGEVLVVCRGDGFDQPALKDAANQGRPCIVVDFAYTSVPNSSFDNPIKDYSENLYNLLRHLEVVRQLPNAAYLYVSSGGTVYGNPQVPEPIREEHRNLPLAPYGVTKLACEHYAMMYREAYGLDVKIVRPSNIYGPGQRPFRGQGIVATMLARMLGGQPVDLYGDGSAVRDYLFVDDFCRALHEVVLHGETGETYNIGSGRGTSITRLLELVQVELGLAPALVNRLPARPFDVRYNVLDAGKLQRLTEWAPAVPLEHGLKRTAAWLKAKTG